MGQIEPGLDTLTEALAFTDRTADRFCEAELHRLQAELLLAQGETVGAEKSLRQALHIARRQQAKSLELRAAMSLDRLWLRQGQTRRRSIGAGTDLLRIQRRERDARLERGKVFAPRPSLNGTSFEGSIKRFTNAASAMQSTS